MVVVAVVGERWGRSYSFPSFPAGADDAGSDEYRRHLIDLCGNLQKRIHQMPLQLYTYYYFPRTCMFRASEHEFRQAGRSSLKNQEALHLMLTTIHMFFSFRRKVQYFNWISVLLFYCVLDVEKVCHASTQSRESRGTRPQTTPLSEHDSVFPLAGYHLCFGYVDFDSFYQPRPSATTPLVVRCLCRHCPG